MNLKLSTLTLLLFLLVSFSALSSGIRGIIYDEEEKPLPFATIYVEELETGTSTNQEGYYEFVCKPGTYTIQYKFVGYETVIKKVVVGDDFKQLDVKLPKQTLLLNEVTTTAKATDPANWMMRKAIAKSAYHRQLIDEYSGRVYVKGKGRLTKIPFYLRGTLKKEGVDTSTLIITESVSEVFYKRPNQFSEKVISVYASKESGFNSNPMPFIMGSFYQDEIAASISPLSSKAFQYYEFKHLGAFMDGENLVNEIKVTPKVKAPNVFEGAIQLVEEDWALYNVDLKTQIDLGFEVNIKQVYQNIKDLAWMPITYQLDMAGKVMGVGIEFKYLASIADYRIVLNPALPKNIKIIDEEDRENGAATDESLAKSYQELKEDKNDTSAEPSIVSAKDLGKYMKEYQKNEADSLSKLDILSVYDYKIDSAAYNQDSTFWSTVRPIPLSEKEERGYAKIDSLNVENEKEAKADSTKRAKRGTFQVSDILFGGNYSFGKDKDWQFRIYNPIWGINFNTVEGLNFDYSIGLKRRLPYKEDSATLRQQIVRSYFHKPYILVKPTVRYSVARDVFLGKLQTKYRFSTGYISATGGRYISQFNNAPAIHPLINANFTLIWEQNYMKLYQKDFLTIDVNKVFSDKWSISGHVNYEERKQLYNNSDFTFIDWKRELTDNVPNHFEPIEPFDGQVALTADISVKYRPFVKYNVRNGIKYPTYEKSPEIGLSYYKGFKDILDSEVDFDRIEASFKDHYTIGAKGTTYISAKVGGFLNNKNIPFIDHAHFPGNLTFITQSDPVESYRMLDYYLYSTDSYYIQTFVHHQFRKFLITQIPATRLLGIKENVFVNYLETDANRNYMELGYGLDGIFKFFRAEIVTNYNNFEYQGIGFRIGISTTFGNNVQVEFNDD